MADKKKILFVCTGNSCRSVMGEGLLRHLLAQRGRNDVQVISAGVAALPGMPPTEETIQVMQELGVDVSGHLSQPLSLDLIDHADGVFCMEELHKRIVLDLRPEANGKVFLLKTFENPVQSSETGIPDPIGRPKEVYQLCRASIEDGVKRVLAWMERP